ncbi:MAG TPA: aryl-sulfate sulfotransferase [Steroidobacteraceae bacterium]|nr:aryl-sulfate sulfotransferase [Steroidobacteraceae bacterium]
MWEVRSGSDARFPARILAGLLGLMAATAGCGGGASHTPASPPLTPPPVPQQRGSVTVSPQQVALGSAQAQHFTATVTGAGTLVWSVNGIAGGDSSLGTVDSAGDYRAPSVVAQSANVVVQAALSSAPQANFATAVVALVQAGDVESTAIPQVAQYTLNLPQPGTVLVQFGVDIAYGRRTWSQPTPSIPVNYGGPVTIEVAGMLGSTTYHMQALATLSNGVAYADSDHTFTTGVPPPTPPVQITTPAGLTPQPGIELFDSAELGLPLYSPSLAQAFATDLQGNVLWTYRYSGTPANVITPIKLLSNGHMLLNLTVTTPATGPPLPPGTVNDIREIDLAGNTIHDLPLSTLNASLAANGFAGITLYAFSRDFLALPNGHFVFLATMAQQENNLTGFPGTVDVAGDVLVDVDQNYKPDWVWSTFDHLDLNRHPYQFPPDWTHSDALLYSSDDGNLLFSIRNQNWIVKIDFQDGAGSGAVLWRLGEGGDFQLLGGVDPADWFYAQHGMNFFSANTSGQFELGVFDDGDDRPAPQGGICGAAGAPACYSTSEVLLVDETAKTATLLHHYVAPASYYSFFGGQTDLLGNGDIEADFCAAQSGGIVQEYQPGASVTETSPLIVWQAVTPGAYLYRALRQPSLYPGVQW